MSKGSYTVYTPQGQNKNDTWKSCTCTLLIFLVICLIIILVVSPLKERSSPDHEKLTDASGQHSSPPEHEHHTMNDPRKQNEKIYYEIISNVPTTTKTVNPTVVTTAMPLTEKYNYVTEDSHTETTKISNIKDDSFNGKPTELTMFQTATKDIILSEPITTVSSVSSHITTDKYNNLKERETYFSTTSKIMTSLEDDHVTEITQETLPNNWSETNPVQSNQNITSGEDFQQIIEKSRLQNLQHGVTTEATPFETFSVTQENIKNGENSQKTTEINQEFFNVTNKDVYLIKEKYNEGVTEKTLSEKSLESDSESALKNNVTPTTIPEKQLTDHISTTSKINYPTTENNPEVVTKIWFYKSYQSGSKTYNSSVITSGDNTTQELVSATDHTSHYGQEFRLTTGHGSHYGQELSSTTEHSSHESSLITDRVPPYDQDIRSTTNHISNYGQELNSTTENASQYGQNLGSTTEHVSHYSQVYPQNFGDRSQNLSGTAIQSSYYKCLTGEPAKPSKVCDSNTCKNIASRSLIYMKHDGDVCKNFYNYACGGISKDYLLERDHSRDVWNRLKDSLDKPIDESSPEYMVTFQKYYASCVDYSPTVGVHPAFETLKNSPTFYEENISAKIPGLTEFLTNLLSNGFAMFFDVIVDVDINTNKLGIVILPMYYDDTIKDLSNNNWKEKDCIQSVLQSDKIYFNKTTYKCKENRLNQTVCLNNFKQALIQLTHSNMSTVIPKVISSFDKNILKIQQMYTPPLSSRNKDILLKGTTTKTLKSLQLRLPQIDWDYMLNILVSRSLPQDTKIQVYNLNYLSNILTEIKKIDKRELHNNILAFYAYKLHKKYNLDQRNVEKRQEYCLEKSALLFPDVSSSAYLDTFTEDKINELHKSAADIFERLKDTLQSDLMWLSNDDDSDRAKNKLKNLKLISLSEYMPWKNKEFLLNRLYDINMTTDFISNTYILEKRNRDQMYSLYDSDPMVPENLWIVLSLPYATKPITVTALNSIILPLGAMSLKIDNPGLPRYALMAELGYTLAKQMNLYLELSGIKILRNDIDQPKDVSFLLNDEVKGKSITLELNPSDSMTEIITDIGGAKLAYNAYEKMVDIDELPDELPLVWLNKTTKQLFFLLMAQQFCTKKTALDDLHSLYEGGELPPLFAVNSIAANSDDFIAAYGCPSDGNMTAGIAVQIQHPSSSTAATPELMDNNITNFDTTDDDETGLL